MSARQVRDAVGRVQGKGAAQVGGGDLRCGHAVHVTARDGRHRVGGRTAGETDDGRSVAPGVIRKTGVTPRELAGRRRFAAEVEVAPVGPTREEHPRLGGFGHGSGRDGSRVDAAVGEPRIGAIRCVVELAGAGDTQDVARENLSIYHRVAGRIQGREPAAVAELADHDIAALGQVSVEDRIAGREPGGVARFAAAPARGLADDREVNLVHAAAETLLGVGGRESPAAIQVLLHEVGEAPAIIRMLAEPLVKDRRVELGLSGESGAGGGGVAGDGITGVRAQRVFGVVAQPLETIRRHPVEQGVHIIRHSAPHATPASRGRRCSRRSACKR